MKKLLIIPILIMAMGFSVAPLSITTPEVNARDYRHHRGHGHYKHHRHRHYRHRGYHRYKHHSYYRPYRYKRYGHHRPYRYRRHSDTNFFLGLSFPGLLFGASHFDYPHHHGLWCYR